MAAGSEVARNTVRRDILQRLYKAAGLHHHPFSAAELAQAMGLSLTEEFISDLNSLREQGYVRYEKSSSDHLGTFPVQLDSRGLSLMESPDLFNRHFPSVFNRESEWTKPPDWDEQEDQRSVNFLRRTVLEALWETFQLDPDAHVQQASLLHHLNVAPTTLTPVIKMLEHEGYLSMTAFLDGDYMVKLADHGTQLLGNPSAFNLTFPPEPPARSTVRATDEPSSETLHAMTTPTADAKSVISAQLDAIQQQIAQVDSLDDRQTLATLIDVVQAWLNTSQGGYQGMLAPFADALEQNPTVAASVAAVVWSWLTSAPNP